MLSTRAIVERAPELLFFPAVGLVLWIVRKPREPGLAALSVVVPLVALVTAMKVGSDLNYFLGLRLVAALGAGAVWGALRRRPEVEGGGGSQRVGAIGGWLAIAVLGAASLVPGLRDASRVFSESRAEARYFESDQGRAVLQAYQLFFKLAEDPDRLILTDSGPILLRMRDRAPFADPWLFRSLAIEGRVRPDLLNRQIVLSQYEAVISTGNLRDRGSLNHQFLLPPGLIISAVQHYLPAFAIAPGHDRYSLYVNLPRVRSRPVPGEIEAASRLAPRTVDPPRDVRPEP
jgi:hypothetical protein